MWPDNELDAAFRRLAPPEDEGSPPEPFPLSGWQQLEARLEAAATERLVRRRLWQFFGLEVAVLALALLLWQLWPGQALNRVLAGTGGLAPAAAPAARPLAAARPAGASSSGGAATTTRQVAGSKTEALQTPQAAADATSTALAASGEASHSPSAANQSHELASTPKASSPAGTSPVKGKGYSSAPSPTPGVAGSLGGTPPRPRRLPPLVAGTAEESATGARHGGYRGGQSAGVVRQATAGRSARLAQIARDAEAGPTSRPSSITLPDQPNATQHLARSARGAKTLASKPGAGGLTLEAAASLGKPGATSRELDSLSSRLAALQLPDSAATLPAPLLGLDVAEDTPPVFVREPRLYLGVVGAPDVSTVAFADVQRPQANLGLTLEYRLGQRWRLSTGLLRGAKVYRARREDYDFSFNPFSQQVDYSWVDARCVILDLPLNLRYDFGVGPQYRLFAGAGLSTLFMQREEYSYDFEYYGQASHWTLDPFINANRHPFSVLNLSAGYERALGGHWRLQAEPYVKVPLGGVGAGHVKLLSGGVFFGLKYGF